MENTDRAEFPDYNHPLYTPDPDAQAAVVERIKRAMKTGERRPRQYAKPHEEIRADGRRVFVLDNDSAWDGSISSIAPRSTRYTRKPMGERWRLTNEDIGKAWGLGREQARKYLVHPEKLDWPKTFALHHLLGVTLDWLRGWTNVNAYGRYEDNPQVVAKLYDRLSPYDKEHACYMLMSLLGEDAQREVYEAENEAYMEAWRTTHPDEVKELQETLAKAGEAMRRFAESEPLLVAMAKEWHRTFGYTEDTKRAFAKVMARTQRANEQKIRDMGHPTTGAELLARQAAQQVDGNAGAIAGLVARAARESADEQPDQPSTDAASVDEP